MYLRGVTLAALLTSTVSIISLHAQTSATDGREMSGYQVQQVIELGYRFTDVNGSVPMYNTFINQADGVRVLDQSITARSMQQTGTLFDDLSASSFGWGGDPENVARLRMTKYRWYDFTGLFRRDKNFFDYNLFANPLNPPTNIPNIPVNLSPHSMFTTRRMYDFGLSLAPQSRFTVRLGYSHNRSEGPSFSSFHEGTDVLLNQPWSYTNDEYRIGFDFKVIPRTTISYDQFVNVDKNDTDFSLAPFATFPLPGGIPVELGLPWNSLSASPCAVTFLGTTVNPNCNGYFTYTRTQRVRMTTPTEQLAINSTYFRRLNLTGRVSYSSGELVSPFNEFFDGFVQRTGERQFTTTGPIDVRRVATTADFGATLQLSRAVLLSDSFRFDNLRIPGSWNSVATSTVGLAPSLLSGLGATTITPSLVLNFLGQKTYHNLIQLEFIPSKKVGGHIGYRFRHRHVFKAEPEGLDPEAPFEGFEGDSIDVNENAGLGGIWFRPTDALKINFDVEAVTADNFITRISPRQWQSYKARVNYKAGRAVTLALYGDDFESRNGESDTQAKQHLRNYGLALTALPNERFNLELAYNYTDALQNAFICYNSALPIPGTVIGGCPTFDPAQNPNGNLIFSRYQNSTNYVNARILFSPAARLHLGIGYGLTKTDGSTTLLNPLQPFGPLQFTYHQPLASIGLDLVKNFSLNAYWNYDQYNEASFVGPTLPRYFHDNRTVLSAKYAF